MVLLFFVYSFYYLPPPGIRSSRLAVGVARCAIFYYMECDEYDT